MIQTLLAILVSDILPIFLIASAGFLLARYSEVRVRAVARVTFNVLAPCLVFTLILTSTMSLADFGRMALFCVLVTAIMGLAAAATGRLLALDRASLIGFVLVVMFSNSGNYGLPVAMFAFGREALTFATVYFVTSSILTYTFGVFLAASGRRSIRDAIAGVARVPTIYAVAVAALVLTAGVGIPTAIMRPVSMLSDAALPMMILILGMQLERTRAPERPAVTTSAVALCLLVAPAVAIGLAFLMPLTGAAFQAGIIQASMPAAVVTTIIALEFEVAPGLVTNVVFLSTLLSPLTLTALIAWLQRA